MRGKVLFTDRRGFFKLCLELASSVEGERKKDGKPPLYPDCLYIALLRSYSNLTYREAGSYFGELFPGEPYSGFQALHWYMREKLSQRKSEELLEAFKERLLPFLPEAGISMLDATGVPYRGKLKNLDTRGEIPTNGTGTLAAMCACKIPPRKQAPFTRDDERGWKVCFECDPWGQGP